MDIYYKNCKKHTVLISDEKGKAKSKCTECLTDRTFFDKINDEYDIEKLAKYIFFLLMYFIKEHEDVLRKV